MFRSEKSNMPNFRADYAKHADFCEVFQRDMKPLYLLAFLLTVNHKDAEQCFALTVEDAFKKPAVFKEWAQSWVKRSLIEHAIDIVSPASARTGEKRDLWSAHQSHGQGEIDAVAKLAPLERFVFVMSILERNSNWDCALLLGCNTNKVAQARRQALRRLPDLASALFPRAETWSVHGLEVTA